MLQKLLDKFRKKEDPFKNITDKIELTISKTFPNYVWGFTHTHLGRQRSLFEPKQENYLLHMRAKDKLIAVYHKGLHFNDLILIVESALTNIDYEKSETKIYTSFKIKE